MPKYDIHSAKRLKFARFGGLSSVNQRGYRASMPDFHSPPARRGFYCFVWPFYEPFLLGASCTKDPYVIGAKFTYVRGKDGKIVDESHPEYAKFEESTMESNATRYWTAETKEWKDFKKQHDYNPNDESKPDHLHELIEAFKPRPMWAFVEKPSPRIFEHDGEIWHHLVNTLSPGAIIARKGSWVKSTVSDYREALYREMHDARIGMMKNFKMWMPNSGVQSFSGKHSLNRGIKDHLECFIEKL